MAELRTKLHLGCGLITPQDWINVDASWNARLAKHPLLRKMLAAFRIVPEAASDIPWRNDIFIHNVRKPLPFPDGSMTAIYSSHLLEHLYLEEADRLLKDCFRVLRSGGVLRVVVPDLRSIVMEYVGQSPFAGSGRESAHLPRADRLNRRLLLRAPQPPCGSLLYRIYVAVVDFHSHKWMYDADSLSQHLEGAGFVEVQQMQLHQSRISGIAEVEEPGRVLHGEGICMEAVKPHDGLPPGNKR